MSVSVDIAIEGGGWSDLPDARRTIEDAVRATVSASGAELAEGAEVSVLLCDDRRIAELNRDWRGLDKPTNVLSFPAADADALATAPLLGDIAVAYETVARECAEEDKPFADHLSHMIVHGFLHLLGYDHETDDEAEDMEALERSALQQLGVPDPYAATIPVRGGTP